MEKIKYIGLLEEAKDKEIDSVNKTLQNLNKLFKSSGCDEQICEIIERKLPTTVEGDMFVSRYNKQLCKQR